MNDVYTSTESLFPFFAVSDFKFKALTSCSVTNGRYDDYYPPPSMLANLSNNLQMIFFLFILTLEAYPKTKTKLKNVYTI